MIVVVVVVVVVVVDVDVDAIVCRFRCPPPLSPSYTNYNTNINSNIKTDSNINSITSSVLCAKKSFISYYLYTYDNLLVLSVIHTLLNRCRMSNVEMSKGHILFRQRNKRSSLSMRMVLLHFLFFSFYSIYLDIPPFFRFVSFRFVFALTVSSIFFSLSTQQTSSTICTFFANFFISLFEI